MTTPTENTRLSGLRTVLFTPADQPQLVEKAANSSADAVCLDLEDAVAAEAKVSARQNLYRAAAVLAEAGKCLLVRVNSELECLGADLAALPPSCQAVILPKTQGKLHLTLVAAALERMAERSASCQVQLIGMVEDPAALAELEQPGGFHPRVAALTLGAEDLAATLHCLPESPLIHHSFYRLAQVAHRHQLALWGYPGSIAEFRDLPKLAATVRLGQQAGASAALCIHPAQLSVVRQVFVPETALTAWATAVVAAFEQAEQQGQAVVAVDGKMVDRPVYLQALAIIKAT